MSNSKKISFLDFVTKYKRIRIPRIQRDYAQGRTNDKINEIRKMFVMTLMRVAKGISSQQELDYIYGSNISNSQGAAYEPLDGQQRLTTLFLLHWMLGSKHLLCDDMEHSVLTYETRITAQEFCDELVKHSASDYINEAKKAHCQPSQFIKTKGWFKWSWKFDPTIQSMLVMIDAIYEEMSDVTDTEACLTRLNNITFKERELDDLGATDELFVKMNARGKQLSEFDILKSILEEELQIQKTEDRGDNTYYASDEDEKQWRSKMDGEWIDLFWNKYAKDIIGELLQKEQEDLFDNTTEIEIKKQKIQAATLTEIKFRRLLLRLIALQLFENGNTTRRLREACYQVDEKDLNNIIYAYQDQMITSRRDVIKESLFEDSYTRIDFAKLMSDMDNLVYLDKDGIVKEVTGLLDSNARIDSYAKPSETILDSFLTERLQNYVNLIFYSILLYLRVVPQYPQESGKPWIDNLCEWAKAMRNILHNDNLNNLIGKIELVERAFEGLNDIVNDFSKYIIQERLKVCEDSSVVIKFFASLNFAEKKDGYTGLDNASLNEEIRKSQFKLSDERWISVITRAEANTYLWGQIRCLLDWSDGNIDKFITYSEKLNELLDYTSISEANKLSYYVSMLCVVPDAWRSHYGLYLFNKVRDNSIKRCLRNKFETDHFFGQQQKELIDSWINGYNDFNVAEFFDAVRIEALKTASGWRRCVIDMPSLLDFSYHKKIFEDSTFGHVVLAQLKTIESHCIDPILKYIDLRYYGNNTSRFNDSKSATPHSLEIIDGDKKSLIKWSNQYGYYTIVNDDLSETIISEEDLVEQYQLKK